MTYIINYAVLTTYGGRKQKVMLDKEIINRPIKKVEDEILDKFSGTNGDDPFVKCSLSIKEI
jgi:hypothetical protein